MNIQFSPLIFIKTISLYMYSETQRMSRVIAVIIHLSLKSFSLLCHFDPPRAGRNPFTLVYPMPLSSSMDKGFLLLSVVGMTGEKF